MHGLRFWVMVECYYNLLSLKNKKTTLDILEVDRNELTSEGES